MIVESSNKIEIVSKWVNDLFDKNFKSGWGGDRSLKRREDEIALTERVISGDHALFAQGIISMLQSDCANLIQYCNWSESEITSLLGLFGFRSLFELNMVYNRDYIYQKQVMVNNHFIPFNQFLEDGAILSDNRVYRFALWRTWDPEKAKLNFVMLNPSTADEKKDDPTIRRCIGFAKGFGYGGIIITNLFSYRATDPKKLYTTTDDECDPKYNIEINNKYITLMASYCEKTIFAWGTHGRLNNQDLKVSELLPKSYCLGVTVHNNPRHPLYLPKSTPMQKFCIYSSDLTWDDTGLIVKKELQ